MTITLTKDTTAHLNSNATLALCDDCGEHAPAFRAGPLRLCPLCAVSAEFDTMEPDAAQALAEALIRWITTPMPVLDCSDDEFYARMDNGRAWDQHKIDLEAERQARKLWVASVCEDVAA